MLRINNANAPTTSALGKFPCTAWNRNHGLNCSIAQLVAEVMDCIAAEVHEIKTNTCILRNLKQLFAHSKIVEKVADAIPMRATRIKIRPEK